MRAVVLNGERDVSVEDVPDAGVPGPDGLLLRVDRTAICGSDLHLYHGPMTIPGVHLGHEFVGTVEDGGRGGHERRQGRPRPRVRRDRVRCLLGLPRR